MARTRGAAGHAGALETVALEPPAGSAIEISDSKSQTAGQGPEAKIDPPAENGRGTGRRRGTGSEAHPAAPARGCECPQRIPCRGWPAGRKLPPDLLQEIDTLMQGKFKRRTPGGRSEGVRYGGGTPQSEEAVERALRWLAVHQRQDGSWNFNHLSDACQHYCTHPGSEGSTTAATGLALLPFLGAGYTHKEGEFQDAVQRGLDYLKSRGIKISYGNDLRDGSMYGQALATIALCEAYGMTHDAELKEAAQGGSGLYRICPGPQHGRLALQSGRAGRHDGHRLDADGPEERPDGAAERPVAGDFRRPAVPRQRAEPGRLAVWLPVAEAAARHDGHRPVVPHVYRLAARQAGPDQRRRPTQRLGTCRKTASITTITPRRSSSTGAARSGTPGTARCANT